MPASNNEAHGPSAELRNVRDRTLTALEALDLSLGEYFLLSTVSTGTYVPPEELLTMTLALADGDERDAFTKEAYRELMEELQRKGLLHVVDERILSLEQERRQRSNLPELETIGLSVGVVDFTPAGFMAERRVSSEVFGVEFLIMRDTGWNSRGNGSFEVLSPDVQACERLAQEIAEAPESYGGLPDVAELTRAEKIGAWKPHRYFELDTGFRCILRTFRGVGCCP